MVRYFLIFVFILVNGTVSCQEAKILKGASEFRNIVLDSFLINFQKIESIRRKLDSVGVSSEEFTSFYSDLDYVSEKLNSDELLENAWIIDRLKSLDSYKSLNTQELGTILKNINFVRAANLGILEKRYPHRLDVGSLRLKEMLEYEVKLGDRILHFSAYPSQLCEILYLSYDSIQVYFNPNNIEVFQNNKIFDAVASSRRNPSSTIKYVFNEESTSENNRLYDKIFYECIENLFYRSFPDLEKNLKIIHNLLADDGELIINANTSISLFDGTFPDIKRVDRKIGKFLESGFEIKDKIYSEGDYIVYKFKKTAK